MKKEFGRGIGRGGLGRGEVEEGKQNRRNKRNKIDKKINNRDKGVWKRRRRRRKSRRQKTEKEK